MIQFYFSPQHLLVEKLYQPFVSVPFDGDVKEKTQAIKLGIQKGDYIIKLMEFDQSLGTYLHRVCEAKRMVLILHPLF